MMLMKTFKRIVEFIAWFSVGFALGHVLNEVIIYIFG